MACGGDRLHITAGDALLAVLRIYTYTELCEKSSAEMKTLVVKMWEELKLLEEPDPILVKLDPAAEKKQSIFQKAILPQEPKPCLVAFIHDKTPEASGWMWNGRWATEFGQGPSITPWTREPTK